MAASDDDIPVLTDIVEGAAPAPDVNRAGGAPDEPPTLSILAEPAPMPPASFEQAPRFDWGTAVDDTPPYALGGAGPPADRASDADVAVAEAPPAAAFAAPADPAANTGVDAGEARDALETRLFEALAARMDRLLDERLEALVPSIVEAALAGVKAGLSASVRQALRESVEAAIRDEFERRP